MEIAWVFKSGEPQSIQCNPIIVDGIIYNPISGNYIAAINGYNGNLIWKSKKYKSSLAKRGLIYWKDSQTNKERIFFSNEKNLMSLNAKDASFLTKFGSNGLVRTGLNLLPPANYDNQIIKARTDEIFEMIKNQLKHYTDTEDIKKICLVNYDIGFVTSSPLSVKGDDAHGIFSWLVKEYGKSPKWNFYKYLFDRNGKLSSSWSSMTKPDNSKILSKINNLL